MFFSTIFRIVHGFWRRDEWKQLRPSFPTGLKGWIIQCPRSILVSIKNWAAAPQGGREAAFLSTSISFPQFLGWFILLILHPTKIQEKIVWGLNSALGKMRFRAQLPYLLWTPLPRKPFSQNALGSFWPLPLLLPKRYGRSGWAWATLFLRSFAHGCDDGIFPSL